MKTNAPKWLLLGTGVSNQGAISLLEKLGEPFCVSKAHSPGQPPPFPEFSGFAKNPIKGTVASPGIPKDDPLVKEALAHGFLGTEVDLAIHFGLKHYGFITGTNGKSTICQLCTFFFNSLHHNAHAVGNIGTPVSEGFSHYGKDPFYCIELSSYQAEYLNPANPKFVIFSNFSSDHLARHKSLQNYFFCKWRAVENLSKEGVLITTPSVLNQAKAYQLALPEHILLVGSEKEADYALEDRKVFFKGQLVFEFSLDPKNQPCPLFNALLAGLACQHVTAQPLPKILAHFPKFSPLSHRLELIRTQEIYPIINDSKATNCDAVGFALESLAGSYELFLGGKPKGDSFKPLLHYKKSIHRIFAFGEALEQIKEELSHELPVFGIGGLKESLKKALLSLKPLERGILFSPGCASFDEFANFEERGLFFKEIALEVFDVLPPLNRKRF